MTMRWKCGKSYFWTKLPGFEYSAIIGNYYYSPTSVVKLFEQAHEEVDAKLRATVYGNRTELVTGMEFIAWQQYEFTEYFHDLFKKVRTRGDGSGHEWSSFLSEELECYVRYGAVGRTSQRIEGMISHSLSGKPLFHRVGVKVFVNPKTRQPSPYPDFVKKHFATNRDGDFIKMERKFPDRCTKKVSPPSGVLKYTYPSTCLASQTDVNNHLNQSSYVTICFDALAEALHRGFFENIKFPVWEYNISRISLLYLKEASIGDNLTTLVWQDEGDKFIFCFHVMKEGDVICQAEYKFFLPEARNWSKL